jgi:hypothetical protein
MQSTVSDAQASVDALKVSAPASVDDAVGDLSIKLAEAAAALHNELQDQVQKIGGDIVATKEYADDIIDTGNAAIKGLEDDIGAQLVAAKATQVEQQKCAAQQLLWVSSFCRLAHQTRCIFLKCKLCLCICPRREPHQQCANRFRPTLVSRKAWPGLDRK